VIDAIALFESGLSDLCDTTVAVIADKSLRHKRIMARDNLTEQEAWMRINAQKSDEFYIENADVVIYNNESVSNEDMVEVVKRELM
jgi:dephospho-CoA kinase